MKDEVGFQQDIIRKAGKDVIIGAFTKRYKTLVDESMKPPK